MYNDDRLDALIKELNQLKEELTKAVNESYSSDPNQSALMSMQKDAVNPALAPKEVKIKELQTKIDAGKYKPDAGKIADKIIERSKVKKGEECLKFNKNGQWSLEKEEAKVNLNNPYQEELKVKRTSPEAVREFTEQHKNDRAVFNLKNKAFAEYAKKIMKKPNLTKSEEDSDMEKADYGGVFSVGHLKHIVETPNHDEAKKRAHAALDSIPKHELSDQKRDRMKFKINSSTDVHHLATIAYNNTKKQW